MNNFEYEFIIMICCGIHCTENKSIELRKKIEEELNNHSIKNKTFIFFNGCFGLCRQGPIVEIIDPYFFKTTYNMVNIDDVNEIIESHLVNHIQVERLLLKNKL